MFHRGIMSLFAARLLLATRLPHASAIDLEKLCNEHMLLCLESFVWCDRPTNDRHCEYPDDTFPLKHSGNSGVAGLLWSTKYNLTWSKTDLEYPVLIIWRASRSEDERKDFLWQKNITSEETSSCFKFKVLPNEVKDLNQLEVSSSLDSMLSTISISQPERNYPGIDDPSEVADHSDPFVILGDFTKEFFKTQREFGADEESRRWSRAVGIGAGIGVPMAMAVSGIVGSFISKRLGTRSGNGNSRCNMTSNELE